MKPRILMLRGNATDMHFRVALPHGHFNLAVRRGRTGWQLLAAYVRFNLARGSLLGGVDLRSDVNPRDYGLLRRYEAQRATTGFNLVSRAALPRLGRVVADAQRPRRDPDLRDRGRVGHHRPERRARGRWAALMARLRPVYDPMVHA